MPEERNQGSGPGRAGGERGRGEDPPGWNASASGGSHGAGGGGSRGGHGRGYGEGNEGEGRLPEGSKEADYQEWEASERDVFGVRSRGRGRQGRPGPESGPETWVGRARGREPEGYPGWNTPQSWQPDDYTLSTERQGGTPRGGRGPYAGRGPQGYRRSDDRIREDVCDRLTEHGGIDASELRVQVADGEVTLEGRVAERVQKWMAEEVADTVPGVRDVHNQIRLRGRGGAAGGDEGAEGGAERGAR